MIYQVVLKTPSDLLVLAVNVSAGDNVLQDFVAPDMAQDQAISIQDIYLANAVRLTSNGGNTEYQSPRDYTVGIEGVTLKASGVINTGTLLTLAFTEAVQDYIIGNAVVGELAAMRAEWPEHQCPDGGTMMPGTRVHNGTKLNHAVLSVGTEDPLAEVKSLLNSEGLDWEVMVFAPYYSWDAYETDPDTGESALAPFDLPPGPELIDWMADTTDANDNPVRPTAPVQMHHLGGGVLLTVPEA